ncbi:hypothetical protein PYW08_012957 [Mythimna loreyi]|uniref:Uncharacterized protein n=1 Tax=Mythimna loreyi TaxID=667449 RepID=A0ACC2PZH2_9NEOP|nr:hypothetical protein PYW08_012957 [Mythimna loreyi]
MMINSSLKHLHEQIKSMKESTQQPELLTTHDIHQYTVLYGLVAAVIVVIIIWLLRRRCQRAGGLSIQGRTESVPASVSVCINQSEPQKGSSVSARNLPLSEMGPSVSDSARVSRFSKQWSSLRLKRRDMSTSPIAKRQPVFFIDDSTV